MKAYAQMTTVKSELKEGTKTVFVEVSREVTQITEEQYNNIVDSSPFFRRLGGSEHHTRGYTCKGYKSVRINSKSPSRDKMTVRHFDFEV
jgi:hypothetical protein